MTPNPVIEPELVETLRYQYAHEGAPEETREAADAITALQEKVRRLEEALRLGIQQIENEREITVSCNTILYKGNPNFGKVVDPEALEEIEYYDEFLNAARTALNGSPDQ